MPENDQNYSVRWKEIKRLFTKGYLAEIGPGAEGKASRGKRGEAAIWHRRFWEHTIRDQENLNRHIETIHYNPVKDGLVKRMADWPWSSFHRFVKLGTYDLEWGPAEDMILAKAVGEFRRCVQKRMHPTRGDLAIVKQGRLNIDSILSIHFNLH
jgi:hypothetical protein